MQVTSICSLLVVPHSFNLLFSDFSHPSLIRCSKCYPWFPTKCTAWPPGWPGLQSPSTVLSHTLSFTTCTSWPLHAVPPPSNPSDWVLSLSVSKPLLSSILSGPSTSQSATKFLDFLGTRSARGRRKINSWFLVGVGLWIFYFNFLFYWYHNIQIIK